MATLRSNLGDKARAARRRANLVIAKTAADIEVEAKMRSRVDTGQMRAGWSIDDAPRGGDVIEREVFNPVEHSIFNEFGTDGGEDGDGMSAQPMLTPAVEHARPGFHRAIRELFE